MAVGGGGTDARHRTARLLDQKSVDRLRNHVPARQSGAWAAVEEQGQPGALSRRSLRSAKTARHETGGPLSAVPAFVGCRFSDSGDLRRAGTRGARRYAARMLVA